MDYLTVGVNSFLIKSVDINQKGAAHLLLPVLLILISAVAVASATITTTTSYPSRQVQGVLIAAKGGNSDNSNSNRPDTSTSQPGNQGGRSEEAKTNPEVKTNNKPTTTGVKETGKSGSSQGTGTTTLRQLESTVVATDSGTEESSGSGIPDETLNGLRSISSFPLRIDLSTNQLIMTKNGVERVLTVLPAKAVQNMLRAHLKKGLGPKFFQEASPSASPIATDSATPTPEFLSTPSATPTVEPIATESANISTLNEQITLEEENGEFVYKIPARKHLKVLGVIPVTTSLTGYVSAETGVLIKEQESLLAKVLDFLSP